MTMTDAALQALTPEELAVMLEKAEPAVWGYWTQSDIQRLLATIAAKDAQIQQWADEAGIQQKDANTYRAERDALKAEVGEK